MSIVRVTDYKYPGGWTVRNGEERARWYCSKLEEGNILVFEELPFELREEDLQFLLSHQHAESVFHKNVSYRPTSNLLRGFSGSPADAERLRKILAQYSHNVSLFLSEALSPYANGWSFDYASFRPLEEENRNLPLHKRNDLLHVDAFPSRPTAGKRILRVFTNIHPEKSRNWNTGEAFQNLAPAVAADAGLNKIVGSKKRFAHRALRPLLRAMNSARLPVVDRSAYDAFMLHFHNYLKENGTFQKEAAKFPYSFPPRCTWIVFTDGVPHAVLSGQSALEQTFIIALESLVLQEQAPIRILEKLAGVPLAP